MAVAAVVGHALLLAAQETATGTADALLTVATAGAVVVGAAADVVAVAEGAAAIKFYLHILIFIIGGSQFFVL